MPFIVRNLPSLVQQSGGLRRSQPAAEPDAQALEETGPSDTAQPRVRQRESFRLLLSHLRIDNEPDHELATIPTRRRGNVNPLRPPADEATAALRGRSYLTHLSTDSRVGGYFRSLLQGRYILADPRLDDAKAEIIAERLRPIVGQCLQDPALMEAVEDLAAETLGRCGDGTQVFIGKMEVLAILSFVRRGEMNEDDLYNLGVSFFRLDAVQTAVGRRTPPGVDPQNVHNTLNAEAGLQHELNLPTHHTAPYLPEMGFVTPAVLREIGDEVKARLTADEGAQVIDYLSNWEPWQEFVCNHPRHRADFEAVTDIFQRELRDIENEWQSQDPSHPSLSHEKYLEKIDRATLRRAVWINETAGQKAAELLRNARAVACIERGNMPDYFC